MTEVETAVHGVTAFGRGFLRSLAGEGRVRADIDGEGGEGDGAEDAPEAPAALEFVALRGGTVTLSFSEAPGTTTVTEDWHAEENPEIDLGETVLVANDCPVDPAAIRAWVDSIALTGPAPNFTPYFAGGSAISKTTILSSMDAAILEVGAGALQSAIDRLRLEVRDKMDGFCNGDPLDDLLVDQYFQAATISMVNTLNRSLKVELAGQGQP